MMPALGTRVPLLRKKLPSLHVGFFPNSNYNNPKVRLFFGSNYPAIVSGRNEGVKEKEVRNNKMGRKKLWNKGRERSIDSMEERSKDQS